MSFAPLGDTLQGKGIAPQKEPENSEVLNHSTQVFVDLFGEDLGSQAKPLFLKNRTLTVSCSSSEIAQEIRTNQAVIVEKINDKLTNPEVDRIRYLV